MLTNIQLLKENKNDLVEKSNSIRFCRKIGLFDPIEVEIIEDLKSGSNPTIKSEILKIKFPEKIEKKSEKRSENKTRKKEKKENESEKYFSSHTPTEKFLPMNSEEVEACGWKELDIILVTGDAYVDHSSFGTAIIGRVLEDAGFRIGIIAQPRWDNSEDFKKLGMPKLFFSISAGNTDSMISNLTPGLKPRNKDVYSPGGKTGLRPNRAVIIYSNRIKEAFPKVPIIMGGIEASLRRFAHYDYLSNKVRQSILADAPADLVVYGMGELQILELARRLQAGEDIKEIRNIPGTVWKMEVKAWKELKERGNKAKKKYIAFEENDGEADEKAPEFCEDYIEIPSFSEISQDKVAFAKAFRMQFLEQNPFIGKGVIQPHPKTIIIQNRPMRPLTDIEMDHVYELPFTGEAHPFYTEPIPALEMIKLSLTTHRGCFGGCAFCAITQHQGRMIASRSTESILHEAKKLAEKPYFKGIITGVGGPSANMYGMGCKVWMKKGACLDKSCLYPEVCPSLDTSHTKLLKLMRHIRELPGVKKVFTGYGVRYDLALEDEEYLEELCAHHISGQLRIAPEHFSKRVTDAMNKPAREKYEKFVDKFAALNRKYSKEQYIVNYLMSGHPSCTLEDMIEMAEYVRDYGGYTKNVQDFTPTPMTVATCMYYTGLDPFTGKKIYVARNKKEKAMQRALMQYRSQENYELVYEALEKAGRFDLVGNTYNCLIKREKN